MHELSLAQSLLQTAIEVATENNASAITTINLRFGKFALVMEEQFRFCLDLLKEEHEISRDMLVNIEWEDGIIHCIECGYDGVPDMSKEELDGMISSLSCPKCQSYDTRVVKGMETFIENISVKSPD
ncbi:MAG: hydrogenase maturation nickel metallochaperone HypA/HybF [Candidatus Kariarchaeaceae archaeon]|jgi:hydrogenase nickel incorporation protein HypA/HybF